MKNSLHFLFALSLVLCCAFIAGCPQKPNSPAAPQGPLEKAVIGGTFIDGTAYNPEEYAGKVVLLDFWATWCPPCRREIAETVIPMYAKYHDAGLEIIGISCDQDAETVQKYAQENGITWKQMLDPEAKTSDGMALSTHYGVEYIPYPILINRKGEIVAKDLRGDDLVAAVKAELGKSEDAAETEIEKNEAIVETKAEEKEAEAETKAGEDETPEETEIEELEIPEAEEIEAPAVMESEEIEDPADTVVEEIEDPTETEAK
ncbi:MAG: TlpA family protein disulfide reductase [Thermoguttaceae bacterium]|nr:TlpA family protein disulfide reductase [Thermoguttaceae bacterium]